MRTKKTKAISVLLVLMMVLSMLPVTAFAAEPSAEFKTILNEEGKLEVNAYQPTEQTSDPLIEILNGIYGPMDTEGEPNERDHYFMISEYVDTDGVATVTVKRWDVENWVALETHDVELVFLYDRDIKAQVDDMVAAMPANPGQRDPYYFAVTDLAMFNYWVSGGDVEDLLFYSEEFKNYIDYKNFAIRIGRGTDAPFYTDVAGDGAFNYGGTVYAIRMMGARMDHILYVADGTTDLKAAAQARLDAYLGEGVVTVADATAGEAAAYANYAARFRGSESFEEFLALCGAVNGVITDDVVVESDYRAQYSYEVAEAGVSDSYDDWKVSYMNMVTGGGGSLPTVEYLIDMPGLTTTSPCFKAEVGGQVRYFLVEADSSQMVTPAYQNVDVGTEIAVSTEETSVPLDTMLQVEQLTEGAEYDEIMSVLDVEESVTYDIKLHSASKNQYVTQLPSGKFQVKIPVPAELEDKDLIVYYVDANGDVEEYTVTPDGGYAVFETDHFSIYTLAEKAAATPPTPPTPPVAVGKVADLRDLFSAKDGVVTVTPVAGKKYVLAHAEIPSDMTDVEVQAMVDLYNGLVGKDVYQLTEENAEALWNDGCALTISTFGGAGQIITQKTEVEVDALTLFALFEINDQNKVVVDEETVYAIYGAAAIAADKSTESGAGDITHDTEADKNVGSATLTEDANLGDKVLTEAEKAQVAQGKDVSVWLEVEEAQPSAEDAALVEAKLGDYELGMHLDVTLWKQLEGETEQKVTETAGKVSITFTVPEKLLNKDTSKVRSYKLIRVHDGAAELLDAEFDTAKNTVTFETDRFSTYTLVYQDAAKGGSPDTGDAGIALYVGMSVLSAMGTAALVLNQKKRA